MPRLSLPREHGAWLTLSGAVLAGVWLAPDRWSAGGLALSLVAAFLVRAPLETQRPRPWDGAARALCAAAILTGAFIAGRQHHWIAVAVACLSSGAVAASGLARRTRLHRSTRFEVLAMAALGASAGAIALTGRASWPVSIASGLVLGIHAAVSVPLVRSDLRPRERGSERWAMRLGIEGLAVGALALFLLGTPAAALGLLPRAIDLSLRRLTHVRSVRAVAVGIRETAELAGVLAVLLALLKP